MKCSKFVAKIADFEEAYRDTLTKKTRFAAESWTFQQASYILLCILRLDYEQVLSRGCQSINTRTMRISTKQGLAPLALIIIVLLILGGGGYALKKRSDSKVAGKEKE